MHGIYKQGNLPYLAVKSCPKCEQLMPLNAESCSNCGHNFTSKATVTAPLREKKTEVVAPVVAQVVPTYQTEEKEEVKVKEEIKPEEVKKEEVKVERFVFCDNCGAKIIGSQRYCGGCGARVSKRICPSCNQIVDSNLIFCPLCGERLQENNTNISQVETPVSNQPQPISAQPINIFVNPTTGQATINEPVREEAPVEYLSPVQEQTEVEVSPEEPENVNETPEEPVKPLINMGRKRLFLIIQMLLIGVIAAIMVMVPVLTKDTFINSLIPCVKGTSTESMITGKHMFAYVLEAIDNKFILLNSHSVIYPHIVNENGEAIFTSMPFIKVIFNFISSNPSGLDVTVAMIVVVFSYVLLVIALLISFLSGFFGLFIKRPYRGKTLGFVLFTLVLTSLLIYSSTFFTAFKGYDSWLLYALVLVFFVWFIVKLVFNKEAKNYKKAKLEAKEEKVTE